jgi:hypothetical protein
MRNLVRVAVFGVLLAAPANAADNKTPLTLHAVGAQIYECAANDKGELAWKLREPIATLRYGGQTVGRHYIGPTWEHADGSVIRGKPVESKAGKTPDDIPWLVLNVTEHRGSGAFEKVSVVRRVNTRGGVATGSCTREGQTQNQPYEADYEFE